MQNTVSRRTILRLLGGCAGLALVSACSRSDTLDEDTFRQTVIALLGRRHPEWHIAPGANPQTIVIGNAEIYRTTSTGTFGSYRQPSEMTRSWP